MFAYICNDVLIKISARTLTTSQRQDGSQVHRIQQFLCKEFYHEKRKMKKVCSQCVEDPFIFDLRDYPNKFHKPGELMFGNLEVLGWVLVRGIRITPESHMGLKRLRSWVLGILLKSRTDA